MSGYVEVAAHPQVLFGDIFTSSWLHDVFLREDAIALGRFTAKASPVAYQPIPLEARRPNQDLLLAHGRPCQAVVLADDCEIESIILRKDQSGRLLFAAVGPWPEDSDEVERVLASEAFFRHPLRPAAGYPGGVVDLRRLFMIDARAIDAAQRVAGLDEPGRSRLEQRWAAFAGRRGPMAHLRGAEKMARVLDAKGDPGRLSELTGGVATPTDSVRDASLSVARAFARAWELEGEFISGADLAQEMGSDGRHLARDLALNLRELVQLADEAAARLEDVAA